MKRFIAAIAVLAVCTFGWSSDFDRVVPVAAGTAFWNVNGSSNDMYSVKDRYSRIIACNNWRVFWECHEKGIVPVNTGCYTSVYDTVECNVQGCTNSTANATIVGGHVVFNNPGTALEPVGSNNVHIVPICSAHNGISTQMQAGGMKFVKLKNYGIWQNTLYDYATNKEKTKTYQLR